MTALDMDSDDVIAVIADAVSKERCILFLGAGAHAPPPDQSRFEYPAEQRPPIGPALSQQLAVNCNLSGRFPDEDPSNLQRVALFYEIARSRHQLVDARTDAVQTGKRPSPMLRALAELSFPLVVTAGRHGLVRRIVRCTTTCPAGTISTKPYWCGCHIHAVPATWLGHPRLTNGRGSGRREGSGATAARRHRRFSR